MCIKLLCENLKITKVFIVKKRKKNVPKSIETDHLYKTKNIQLFRLRKLNLGNFWYHNIVIVSDVLYKNGVSFRLLIKTFIVLKLLNFWSCSSKMWTKLIWILFVRNKSVFFFFLSSRALRFFSLLHIIIVLNKTDDKRRFDVKDGDYKILYRIRRELKYFNK